MNLNEAIAALIAGKIVRLKSWPDGCVIFYSEDGICDEGLPDCDRFNLGLSHSQLATIMIENIDGGWEIAN